MRKFLLLSVLFCSALTMMAQGNSRELVLVDASGKVVTEGATLSFNKMEDGGFGDLKVIHTGLKVRNTTGKDLKVMLTAEIVDIDNGSSTLQVCFPSECNYWEEKGLYHTGAAKIEPFAENKVDNTNNDRSLETELTIPDAGHCTAILRFYTTDSDENEEEAKPGKLLTTVTLKFNSNATGIQRLQRGSQDNANAVYTLQGTLVGRNIDSLNSLPQGVYLVRMNGKTTKVVVGR